MKNISQYITGIIFLLAISLTFIHCTKDGDKAEKKDKQEDLSTNELIEVINNYRASKGLHKIPVSPSLNKVARLHVEDLVENHPDKKPCNLHSWSNQGSWSSCCYTPDHKNAKCMWNKPRELTKYKGNGYEISAWASSNITAKSALELWKTSSGHHDVILSRGMWKNSNWQSIGAAINKGYAVVWFGKEADPANE